jgi:hypothetical protein
VAVQKLKAELFFFVVAGEEDLAVLVEAVNQTFEGLPVRARTQTGVGSWRSHRHEDMPGKSGELCARLSAKWSGTVAAARRK